jgi:hypothetical protein
MASTFTSILRLELMGTGDQSDTWGTTMDNQLTLIENAIAKNQAISITGGTTTLSTSNGADDQSRSLCIDATGVLVSNGVIIVPSKSKMYMVRNGTSGAFTLTVKTAAGTGVAIPQTSTVVIVYCDGVNVVSVGAVGAIDAATLGGIAASGFFQLAATNVVQKGYSETTRALTIAASAFDLDCALAVVNSVTLNGATTTMTISNAVSGAKFELYIKQDATGGRVITYPANFRFENAATPDLSSTANAVDLIAGRYDSVGGVWNCSFHQNFAVGGAVASSNIILDHNEVDVDLYARAGSPVGAVTVTCTISTGVIISASSTATPALNLVGFAAGSTILITNQGYIIGKGGHGGHAAVGICFSADDDSSTGATAGRNGGNALGSAGAGVTVTINNGSGFIWGGGGGGGGGGAKSNYPNVSGSTGGGGGGGAGGGTGGDPGGASTNSGTADGVSGGQGSTGPSGTGGAGGAGAQYGGASSTGTGGAGGAYGANGTAGTSPGAGSNPPGTFGTAGKAVNVNGSAFTLSSGTVAPNIKGAVS